MLASDGTLYVTSDDPTFGSALYAITSDGAQKWIYKPTARLLSPGLVDREGTFYLGATDNAVYAVDADGNVKFRFPTGGTLSAPALGADGRLYIGSSDGQLYAIGS